MPDNRKHRKRNVPEATAKKCVGSEVSDCWRCAEPAQHCELGHACKIGNFNGILYPGNRYKIPVNDDGKPFVCDRMNGSGKLSS